MYSKKLQMEVYKKDLHMETSRPYIVNVLLSDGSSVKINTTAYTKYHAIDKVYGMMMNIQADRSKYKLL